MDGCQGLQLPDPQNKWHHCFHGLHMVLAFTGNSHDGSYMSGRGWEFGLRVGAGEILSRAWLDVAYSWWADDNPIAMACGRTTADAQTRVFNERITSNYSDIPNNQITYYWWTWRD